MPKIDVASIDDPFRTVINTQHDQPQAQLASICMFCMQTAPSDKFNDLKHKMDCPVTSHEAQTINTRQAKPKPKPKPKATATARQTQENQR